MALIKQLSVGDHAVDLFAEADAQARVLPRVEHGGAKGRADDVDRAALPEEQDRPPAVWDRHVAHPLQITRAGWCIFLFSGVR